MSLVHYQTYGSGHPLILIHGFCETQAIWHPFIRNFPDGVQLITPDLPGFGGSPALEPGFSITDVAVNIKDWIISLGIGKPVVVGHSLGGYVTLALAGQFPALLAGFGLFHSTAYADTPEKQESRLKVIEFVKQNGVATYVDSFIPGLFHQKDNPGVQVALDIARKTSLPVFVGYSKAMRDRPSSEEVLRTTRLPVLLIAGEFDAGIPLATLQSQAALNPNISLCVLRNTGHMGQFESENASAACILGLVNRAFPTPQ